MMSEDDMPPLPEYPPHDEEEDDGTIMFPDGGDEQP